MATSVQLKNTCREKRNAKADYERRIQRLEKIRSDLVQYFDGPIRELRSYTDCAENNFTYGLNGTPNVHGVTERIRAFREEDVEWDPEMSEILCYIRAEISRCQIEVLNLNQEISMLDTQIRIKKQEEQRAALGIVFT